MSKLWYRNGSVDSDMPTDLSDSPNPAINHSYGDEKMCEVERPLVGRQHTAK